MDIKTVDEPNALITDALYKKQKENVSKMRTALLSFTDDNGVSARQAIQGITGMRIYHQIIRIIRFTELMDKLEAKLYESIDYTVNNADVSDINTMAMLMATQEKLQKSMIDSHKLLQPYLDIQEFTIADLAESGQDTPVQSQIMNPEDRDRLRSKAQAVLYELGLSDGDNHDSG